MTDAEIDLMYAKNLAAFIYGTALRRGISNDALWDEMTQEQRDACWIFVRNYPNKPQSKPQSKP